MNFLSQAVRIPRRSLLKRAQDPAFTTRLELNERLWKLGQGTAWWQRFGIWITLYRGKKAVAMAGISPANVPWGPMIAYVVDRRERGKGYGEIVSVRAAIMAIGKHKRFFIAARIDNVPSMRVIVAVVGALKVLYGKRLKSAIVFDAPRGDPPNMVVKVWLD